jgi:hypothetical protein
MRRNLIAFLLLAASVSASATAAPLVAFHERSLQIDGLTPGASIVWISVAIEGQGWMNRIVPREGLLTDSDGDGRITIELDAPLSLRSTWAIVEVSSGAYVVATPEGFQSSVLVPDGIIGRARGLRTSLDLLEIERNEIELLVVRPRVGAWRLTAIEGSPQDADRSNDRVLTMRFADLVPLGTPGLAVPGVLKPGDVVIAIDPEQLSHFATVVGR